MFSGRWFIVAIVFGIGFMWALSNQYMTWRKDDYACYHGRHPYNEVGKQRLIAIGRFNVFYQPKSWGCSQDERYDPKKYQMQNGQLVPRFDEPIN
jgi:hypothetical protein